jgi:aspartate/methionine/tyrosine aminotransferase
VSSLDRLARRVGRIAPFEVMEVLAQAQRMQAAGADVIHLEVGEPDFPTPEPVVQAATRALESEPMFYTPSLGLPALREAIAQFYADRYGLEIAIDRIVVTAGSSAALLLALGMILDVGDHALIGDPGYPCNRHFVTFVDAEPVLVPTDATTDYQVTADLLAAAWTPQTRAVIAASPSNPTGTLIAPDEWARIAALCRERHATLVADEIYQGLVYGRDPSTVLALTDEVIVVNSFSKYFQMTGWRLGWLVVPDGATREIEKLSQNLFICPSTVAQHAALAAFTPETIAILEERRSELQHRRDVLLAALPEIGFGIPARPDGAFYIYADVSDLTDDSFAFAREVLDQTAVALTPGRDFGFAAPDRHMRIAYTQPIRRLQEAVERIGGMLAKR